MVVTLSFDDLQRDDGESDNLEPPCTVAEEPAPDAPPSRRRAHKLRIERALQQAALNLFAQQGYDATTTDEIADLAGVSHRTFFRYFPTKESVLFVGEYGWFQSFTMHFLAQPAELSDFDAARATLRVLIKDLTKIRKALVLYERAISSSTTLRGVLSDRQQHDIATVATAIATRRGLTKPDEACTVLATTVLVMHRRAVMRWLAGPASIDPSTVTDEVFDLVVSGVSPPPMRPRRRAAARSGSR
jgi:AcrR family transcriptional regulator